MNTDDFLNRLKSSPDTVEFDNIMAVIEQHYYFTETTFTNGDLRNEAGENSGSCKLFYFAQLQGLNQQQTLACFGSYYRDDVLKHPDADNHQNIRNFMETAWNGIAFEGEALKIKSIDIYSTNTCTVSPTVRSE
ncbi:MAG: HopJ type III effector protein [Cocleimonas sp.]|nr:HopJ type III effector protein [Cocleimonas sp.]